MTTLDASAPRERPIKLGPDADARRWPRRLISALEAIPRPVLLHDIDRVAENLQRFRRGPRPIDVHYAIKCSPRPRLLRTVAELGGGFDFASPAELDLALATGVSPTKCIYSNTVKYPSDIRYAYLKGVTAFLADSEHEVRKIARNAPGAKLYVRLLVENPDAMHPLGGKFGILPETARDLLLLGQSLGLEPYGTHFHVGTQCFKAEAWEAPIRRAAGVFKALSRDGVDLRFFNIGGGFPAVYEGRPVPTPEAILSVVDRVLNEELPGRPLIVAAEPGRAIAASAAALVGRVMLRATRPDGEWLHLDVGIYHGLNEAIDHLSYPIHVPARSGPTSPFILCGPTCDSADTIERNRALPSSMTEGDLVIFESAGAYSEAMFTRFNGIEPPLIRFRDELLSLQSPFG